MRKHKTSQDCSELTAAEMFGLENQRFGAAGTERSLGWAESCPGQVEYNSGLTQAAECLAGKSARLVGLQTLCKGRGHSLSLALPG